MTAPVSPGSSGSPLLNKRGNVVGVATLNSEGRYQNLNFARSSQDLATLIANIPSGAPVQLFAQWASSRSSARLCTKPVAARLERTTYAAANTEAAVSLRARASVSVSLAAWLYRNGSLSFNVRSAGSVTNVQVVKSTGNASFDGAAVKTLRQWKSAPSKGWAATVPITFRSK